MKIKLPFYENKPDKRCMQVSMKIVLEYFLGKRYTLEKLDELTGKKKHQPTETKQAVAVLHNLGLKVSYYSKEPIEPFLDPKELEDYFREHLGVERAKSCLESLNVKVVIQSSKKISQQGLFEHRKLSFSEIEKYMEAGCVSIMVIDPEVIVRGIGRPEGLLENHSVVVTGFDENNVFFHESGPIKPEPNKKVSKQTFVAACNTETTDSDVIIVCGKR